LFRIRPGDDGATEGKSRLLKQTELRVCLASSNRAGKTYSSRSGTHLLKLARFLARFG